MKSIYFVLLIFSFSAYSQSADFILVKKHGKTIQTIFSGYTITLTTETGATITATINGIKNDTLFLQEYVVRNLPTTIGSYITDTVGSYRYQINYHQIKAIGSKPHKGFDVKGNGGILFSGGVLLTVASGVSYLVDKNKFSAPLLFASMGLGTIGYFLAKGGGNGIVIGKKYQLVYMDMSNTKK